LIRAIRLAATQPDIGGELFQIATNAETTVNELVDLLVPILEEFGVEDVEVTHTDPRQGDVRRNYSDTSKAEEMLGWTCEVNLEEGLRRTASSFVDTYAEE
jgi:UDP-glucose 4-epimerase